MRSSLPRTHVAQGTRRRFHDGASVWICLFVCVLLLLSGTLVAQTSKINGEIRGAVSDPTDAVLPGAEVKATNVGTNISKTTQTNEQGLYVIPDLPPGTYKVTVAKTTFKDVVVNNVELHTSSVMTVNARMQIGSKSETIIVEANAVQVQSESAQVGEVVTGAQVRSLPLNGGNFVQLTQLVPGVSGANSSSASLDTSSKGLKGGVDFSVNGNPTTNNLFLLDGANNNDKGSNRTILIYPSLSSIAEFKMLRNSYGPEYGQASGAIISVVTRQGDNTFHGSVDYAGRNDALDSFDYFDKYTNPNPTKGKVRYNDFGYSLGGPIKKDKLFFFWSQEWNRRIDGRPINTCAPTAAELQGDFSGPGITAAGQQAADGCPGAVVPNIPSAVADPSNPFKFANPDVVGLLIARGFLAPANSTLSGGQNYHSNVPDKSNFRSENVKVDYNVNANNIVEARYTRNAWDAPSPSGVGWGNDPASLIQGSWSQPSQSAVGKLSTTIGTVVNIAQFSFSQNKINTAPGGTTDYPGGATKLFDDISSQIATIYPSSMKTGGIPAFWGGFQEYQSGNNLWMITPYGNDMDTYMVNDDLLKMAGNHGLKAGVLWGTSRKSESQGGGTDAFGGTYNGLSMLSWGVSNPTGNSLANLLYPAQGFVGTESSSNPTAHTTWHDLEFYVGDTWKVRRNLTVEYGFRWSFLREPFDDKNAIASFDPALYDPARPTDGCNGLIIVPGTDPCGDANKLNAQLGLTTNYSSGTAGPNRSLRRNSNHNIAPRLGIAWDIFGDGKTALRVGAGQFYQREKVGQYVVLAGTAPFNQMTGFITRPLDPQNYGMSLPTLQQAGAGSTPLYAIDPRDVTPNSWQWNVTLERQLAANTTLELGYVGNRGMHLTDRWDLNPVLVGNRAIAATAPSPGLVTQQRVVPTLGQIRYFSRSGNSNYHSMQAMLRSRMGKVADLNVAYTWSHSLADVDLSDGGNALGATAFLDPSNPHLNYGNSPINRPHIFTANAIVHLPKLDGRNAFMKRTLGEWDLAMIQTAESGPSLTIYASPASGITSLSGTGNGGAERPNVTGQSCNSGTSGPHILNPNAFTVVGMSAGQLGNEHVGYCHGAPTIDTDFSVYKNWSVTEKVKVQFRLDAFNLFNHPNFSNAFNGGLNQIWKPNVVCGSAACSPTNALITSESVANTTDFGAVNSTLPNIGHRRLQYGLRINF